MSLCATVSEEHWPRLHEELDALFVGPLKHLQRIVVDIERVDQPVLSLDEVLSDDHLDAMSSAFCRAFGEQPRVATYSIWSKWYFATVLPPLVCAAIFLDRLPASRLSDIRLVLDPDYKIENVALSSKSFFSVQSGAEQRFRPLIEGNIRPFIEHFHARTKVSRRVLWSNAGNLLEGVLRHLEKSGFAAPGIAEGIELLDTLKFEDGAKNYLFRPVVYKVIGGESVRRRRVCCLRYLLPDKALCCACPLQDDPEAKAREAAMVTGGDRK